MRYGTAGIGVSLCRRELGQQEDMTARPRAGAMTASPCRPGSAQREPYLGTTPSTEAETECAAGSVAAWTPGRAQRAATEGLVAIS